MESWRTARQSRPEVGSTHWTLSGSSCQGPGPQSDLSCHQYAMSVWTSPTSSPWTSRISSSPSAIGYLPLDPLGVVSEAQLGPAHPGDPQELAASLPYGVPPAGLQGPGEAGLQAGLAADGLVERDHHEAVRMDQLGRPAVRAQWPEPLDP